jgi:hypothetical protein
VVNLGKVILGQGGTGGWEETNLLEESPFLNNVGNCLLADATSFVDVFEGVKFFGALMLDDPHLLLISFG